jgi:transposase
MKEAQKHIDAFELYFKEKQNQRSVVEAIRLVCSNFKVSEKTAYKWKRVFDWDGREAIRSAEINKKVQEQTNTSIVDNKVRYLSLYHKLLDDLEANFKIKIEHTADLERVIKGALLLQDQPTEHKKDDALLNLIEALKDD